MKKIKYLLKSLIRSITPYGIIMLYRRKKIKIQKSKTNKEFLNKTSIFCKYFLKTGTDGSTYFDINGAKLPDIRNSYGLTASFFRVFEDTFLIPLLFGNNYHKSTVELLDLILDEGPYCYKDENIDVNVKAGDIVIDAGAWIGDFSAYSVSKGALMTYAFEPVNDTFKILSKTAHLNGEKMVAINKALSNKSGEAYINISSTHSSSSSLVFTRSGKKEKINLTTLDEFVEINNIKGVDFIKADIEGEERNMLKGAYNVLRNFAPRLAICTYHVPDDPVILESIILDANPSYKIVHLRHKLYAMTI